MRKFRLVCILLLIVMAFSLFAGCSLFTRNEQRYRAQTAIKAGDVEVDLQQVIEFFSNNVYQYITQYGMGTQEAWDLVFPQFLEQAIGADVFIQNFKGEKNTSFAAQLFTNAEYVSDDVIEFYLDSIRISLMTTYDSQLEEYFKDKGYSIKEAENDDRAEFNVIEITNNSFALTDLANLLDREEIEENAVNYKPQPDAMQLNEAGVYEGLVINYTFTQEDLENEELKAIIENNVKELNDRIDLEDDQEAITVEDYIIAQQKAVKVTANNIEGAYFMTVDEYVNNRMKLLLTQYLYYSYLYNEYYEIEKQEDIYRALDEKLINLINQTKEKYADSTGAYASLITGLTNNSFIYTVPSNYENEYGYVKNLLIKFDEDQLKVLEEYKSRYGVSHPEYIAKRAELVNDLKATYFGYEELSSQEQTEFGKDVQKDEDSNLYRFDGEFVVDNGEITSSWLTQELDSIKAMTDKTQRDNAFSELMFMFNEDTAQHNSAYDYIIRLSEPEVSGVVDNWVKEFAEISRELAVNGVEGDYGYCITDYGVHVVYFAGMVTSDFMVDYNGQKVSYDSLDNNVEAEWQAKVNFWKTAYQTQYGAGSAVYRMFKAYYSTVSSTEVTKVFKDIQKEYEDNGKIVYDYDVLKEFMDVYQINIGK